MAIGDEAIARRNAEFLADAYGPPVAREDGDRWRMLLAAENTVGAVGIVLPIALAEAIAGLLDGQGSTPHIEPRMAALMLRTHLTRAEKR